MQDQAGTPSRAYRVTMLVLLAVIAIGVVTIAVKVCLPKADPDPNAFYGR